jgi:LPXTG-site transpeptidase (sortase) family protein
MKTRFKSIFNIFTLNALLSSLTGDKTFPTHTKQIPRVLFSLFMFMTLTLGMAAPSMPVRAVDTTTHPIASGDLIPLQPSMLNDNGVWTPTGSMSVGRWGATETLLPDGKVLVAGGPDAVAELYDPAIGIWTHTNSMATRRSAHTATLLPNDKVLVAGGWIYNTNTQKYEALVSTELYDPATGLWTPTGSMTVAHAAHIATLLPNGRVLVAAGTDMVGKLVSAELYDPATGLWTPTGSLATAREGPTATLLPNGKVLIAGGWGEGYQTAKAELYDPVTGLWTPTGSMAVAHAGHTLTLLQNSKVLVAGSSAELYDPATGLWMPTGLLNVARSYHTATLLTSGKVLVVGGFDVNSAIIPNAELYDPATGVWTSTGSLATARESQTATLLPDGKVLVAAGWSGTSALTSAELYSEILPPPAPYTSPSLPPLPRTGFVPNMITLLPSQPADLAYSNLGSIWLEIPSQNIQTNIVGVPKSQNSWDVKWLGQDAGWLNGTAFPTWEGNSVITAHVTDANGLPGPFTNIKNLKYGDQIIVHLFDEQYIFEVRNTRLARPYSTSFAFEHLEDHSFITLITCQGYNPISDSYLFRRIVRAVLVDVK